MAKTARTTVRLDAFARDSMKSLQASMEADHGVKASRDDIVSALVFGTTSAQALGMLIAFNKHVASVDQAEPEDPGEPSAQ